VAELDRDVAVRTAPLLRAAVEQLALGSAPRIPQDERAATFAPLVRPGVSMISFGEWDVERIWHFLVALVPQYREPLVDETAREVLYDRVIGYRRTPTDRGPGCVESSDHGWLLHCRNGIVRLGRNP
jgi:methionyl-tRNA formyltransferase